MKIKKSRSKRQTFLFIVVPVLIIIAGITTYALSRGFLFESNQNNSNLEEATEEQKEAGRKAKQQTAVSETNSSEKQRSYGSDTLQEPTPQTDGTKTVGVTITAANQTESFLQVRILISALTSDGTCTLSLSKDGNTITKTANVQTLPSSTTCEGFDIPLAEVPRGQVNLSVQFASNDLIGSTSQVVTIK